MKFKIVGLICLLIATSGFGFHNWYMNNKIHRFDDSLQELVEEKGRYVQAFEKFKVGGIRTLVNENSLNIAGLFAKLDLKLSGEIRPQTDAGISKIERRLRQSDRIRLFELAYTASSSREYAERINDRLSKINGPEEYEIIKTEVTQVLDEKIQNVQNEYKALKESRASVLNHRDFLYVAYLIIQLFGVGFTILGEVTDNKKTT